MAVTHRDAPPVGFPFGPTNSSASASITPSPTPTDSASRPSLAAPASCPSAPCTRSGSSVASRVPSPRRFLPSRVDLQPPRTLPAGADTPGGPPSQVLRATGEPPCAARPAPRGVGGLGERMNEGSAWGRGNEVVLQSSSGVRVVIISLQTTDLRTLGGPSQPAQRRGA